MTTTTDRSRTLSEALRVGRPSRVHVVDLEPEDVPADVATLVAQAKKQAWAEGFEAAVDAAPGDFWCDGWSEMTNPYADAGATT